MTTKPILQEIKDKLIIDLRANGWFDILKTFVLSSDFDEILQFLIDDVYTRDFRFTPRVSQIFRAFKETPLDKLQCVFVGQDCYPQLGVADGVSFSCSNTGKPEASLRYILKAVNKTVYNDEQISVDPNLDRWCHQGVLMLNTALTTRVGKIGAHLDVWKPFTNFLFDAISTYKPVTWVLLGKKAEQYKSLIKSGVILQTVHPAYAAYTKQKEWDCDDVFNKVSNTVPNKITW